MNILQAPYSQQEIEKIADANGYVSGCVAVPLSEIINSDFEEFLDMLAVKLVDNECLMDIRYKAVGIENTDSEDANIIMKVSGDISEIVNMNNDR